MTSLPRLSVENPVLVNLFMMVVLVGGSYAGLTLVREMFPDSAPNRVAITTPYPGATPAEVEKGITLKIEEKIKDVDGVEDILSTITEGRSSIIVKLESGFTAIDQAVNDIKSEIDTIPEEDFPEEALETHVAKFEPRFPVISVALYGDLSDRELKTLGEDLRDELLALPDVTEVTLTGTKLDEIGVEVSPGKLVEYGLSFMDVAHAIRASNLDLPGGQVRTKGSTVAVRTLGERDKPEDMLDIVVTSDASGRVVRVSDVGTIVDGFEDVDVGGRFAGKPAVNATVYKQGDQDAISIASYVRALVAGKMGWAFERSFQDRFDALIAGADTGHTIYTEARLNPFPANVSLQVHSDLSLYVSGRLDLLKRNGLWGFLLVAVSLLTFLHWRIALWVLMGLVLALAGSVLAMKLLGQTLNLMTMFGLIVVLGLLVDDAIIVAEHVYTKLESGMEPKQAAIEGAEEVAWPVICAITTTIFAFIPLMFIEGQIGDWMGVLPVVVCIALSVSLLEALTILPAHLAHGLRSTRAKVTTPDQDIAGPSRLGSAVRRVHENLAQNRLKAWYEWFLRGAVRQRYFTMATLLAVLIAVTGAVLGGHVPFVFLQHIDSETIMVNATMEVGAPLSEAARAMSVIEKVALDLPETKTIYTLLGVQASDDGTVVPPQAHLGQVFLEIVGADERDRTSDEIVEVMRRHTDDIVGVRKLSYASLQGGPSGAPIHLEVSGEDVDILNTVSEALMDKFATYDGVSDIVNDFDAGRREVQIELFDSARSLGLTTDSLATQVRAAFYGYEARKIQRQREDVKIMVRYPPEYRQRIYDIENMRIATPSGALVPLTEVARLTEGSGFASIRRKNQRRTVTVTADVNEDVSNAEQVIASMTPTLREYMETYPGLKLEFGGQKLETKKSFGSLKTGFLAALLLIYGILAGLFKSYIEPVIVMIVIPFGLIGAVMGHYIMGYPLTILSMIGLVALTGIVVNDSMILVAFINRRVERGDDVFEAVIEGGKSRLRPILLTSITTVLGIAPLLFERSFQAKFLIPMGVSISGGLVFATVLTLVAIPSLYLIAHDMRQLLGRVIGIELRDPHAPQSA